MTNAACRQEHWACCWCGSRGQMRMSCCNGRHASYGMQRLLRLRGATRLAPDQANETGVITGCRTGFCSCTVSIVLPRCYDWARVAKVRQNVTRHTPTSPSRVVTWWAHRHPCTAGTRVTLTALDNILAVRVQTRCAPVPSHRPISHVISKRRSATHGTPYRTLSSHSPYISGPGPPSGLSASCKGR